MRLAKLFLSIGIAVVFVVFIAYGLYVVYEPPERNMYYGAPDESGCDEQLNCRAMLDDCRPEKQPLPEGVFVEERVVPPDTEDCKKIYNSQEYKQCQDSLKKCKDTWKVTAPKTIHARNSMWVLAIIGIGTILGSMYFVSAEAISSGLLGGGVLTLLWMLIYTAEYWVDYTSKYLKLGVLGIVLIILMYVGYKKIEKRNK
jgi:hypothetical protein